MRQSPRISVVIPHYEGLAALDRCLASLNRQTLPHDAYEVIVADNRSPSGLAEVDRVIDGRARLVDAPIKGAGPARNAGVDQARGDILAFIDADCVASPAWLEQGLEALKHYDFAGGRVDVLVGDENAMTPVEAFECVFAFDFRSYVLKKGFTGSGNLFCSRDLFADVGGFSTGVSEDIEWSHRATAKGYRLGYWDSAAIAHPARVTWDELVAKWRRVNRERYGLARQQRFGLLRWLVLTALVPVSIIPHALRIMTTRKLARLRDRMAAIRALTAIRLWRFVDSLRLIRER